MNTDNFHELRCKLFCFTTEATQVTNKLLEYFSLNCHLIPKTETNPKKALAHVLKYYHTNNNLALDALKYPDNKIKIFTTINKKKCIRNEIPIDSFDLTLSTNILLNIDAFPTVDKIHRLHLKCKHCGIINDKNSVVCCNKCLSCIKCLTGLSISCENSSLQESISLIRVLRNRTSHLTDLDCKKIEQDIASGSKKWNEDVTSYITAIKTLIDYLDARQLLANANKIKANLDFVMYNTKDVYMRIFSETVNKTLKITQTCDETFTLSILCTSPSSLLNSIRNIHSQESKITTTTFLLQVEEILENELNWCSPGAFVFQMKGVTHTQEAEAKKSLNSTVRIHITSSEKEFPDCYKDMYSVESTRFQNELLRILETIIQNVLKIDVKAVCTGWMFESIHVDITYSPTEGNGKKWTSEQIQLINTTLENVINKDHQLIKDLLSEFEMDDCEISTSFPTCDSYTTYEMLIKISDATLYDEVKKILPALNSQISKILMEIGHGRSKSDDFEISSENDELEKRKLHKRILTRVKSFAGRSIRNRSFANKRLVRHSSVKNNYTTENGDENPRDSTPNNRMSLTSLDSGLSSDDPSSSTELYSPKIKPKSPLIDILYLDQRLRALHNKFYYPNILKDVSRQIKESF